LRHIQISRLQLVDHRLDHHLAAEHIDEPLDPLVAENVGNLHAEPAERPRNDPGCLIPAEWRTAVGDPSEAI
jgi:hypothetical protein